MARNFKGRTEITIGIFSAVKFLTKGGATIEECAEYLKIGKSTVSRIRSAESYEEYKAAAKAAFYGYHKDQMDKDAQQKLEEEQKKQEELKKQQEAEELKKKLAESPVQPVPVEPVKSVVHTVQVQATHYMMEELKEMNKALTLISNKLTFIVEQLQ